MVKGLSSEAVIQAVVTGVTAIRRTVTRKLCRIVTPFIWPRNRRDRGSNHVSELGVDYIAAGEIEQHAKIETLPDEILLEVFDCVRLAQAAISAPITLKCDITDPFCFESLDPALRSNWSSEAWEWHRLIHVCRWWRSLVLASPRRLDLRLTYTFKYGFHVMKKAMESWPTLPIDVWHPSRARWYRPEYEDDASFALQHPNRIRDINLSLTRSLLLKIRAQFLASFPALEYLRLELEYREAESQPTLPVGFLGGSASRLRHIHLIGVASPTFPLVLSSARDLISLQLSSVSRRAYFSPETLSIGLSTTTRLKFLCIDFLPFASDVFRETGSEGRQPIVRAILPVLTKFYFYGNSAYLVDLISRIDSPTLERPSLQSGSRTPQLSQFTGRPNPLELLPIHQPILLLDDQIFFVNQFCPSPRQNECILGITSEEMSPQATFPRFIYQLLAHRTSISPILESSLHPWLPWLRLKDLEWVNLFGRLASVTTLEVDGMLVRIIGSVLESLFDDLARGVLPKLQDLHVGKCQTPEPFQEFANARRSPYNSLTVHYA